MLRMDHDTRAALAQAHRLECDPDPDPFIKAVCGTDIPAILAKGKEHVVATFVGSDWRVRNMLLRRRARSTSVVPIRFA